MNLQDQPLLPFEDVVELHKQEKYTSAFPLFQQYAALSHQKSPLAKFYCGYYLYHGKFGVNKDEDSAIEYLRQAADANIVRRKHYMRRYALKVAPMIRSMVLSI